MQAEDRRILQESKLDLNVMSAARYPSSEWTRQQVYPVPGTVHFIEVPTFQVVEKLIEVPRIKYVEKEVEQAFKAASIQISSVPDVVEHLRVDHSTKDEQELQWNK